MGLGALYAEMVQPSRPLRATFLAKLLQPFDSACNLNSPAAAATDLRCVKDASHGALGVAPVCCVSSEGKRL